MILIALGANLPCSYGSPEETLKMAMLALENVGVHIIASSSIWVTKPVPASLQPLYRNAVVSVRTKHRPESLLKLLHVIEADFGRVRKERNEARVLDLDLIAYGETVIHDSTIDIPHPRMHERGFVLAPLCEINAQWYHPVLQKTAEELLAMLPIQDDMHIVSAAA